MTEVISVKFKNNGKVYYFDPNGVSAEKGQFVIVETSKGIEYAECAQGNHEVDDASVIPPLRPVIRIATEEDTRRAEENRKKEADAFAVCQEKIAKHELDMKLVDVEYNFEGSKILFFFTSDGRVDFRELVKDLASVFKTRIELRQIGIRDEARMLGGLGICGKPFCCSQFLDDFQPVSIKMAKTQGLSLNPAKISGTCGRLMCCIKYEQEAYEELVKNVPKVDAFVQTPMGKGSVIDVNLLRGRVRVRLEDSVDTTLKTFDASEIEVLGGKAKRAEYLALKAEGKGDPPPERPRRQFDARAHVEAAPKAEAAPAPVENVPAETVEPKPEKPHHSGSRRPRHNRSSKPHSDAPAQQSGHQNQKQPASPRNQNSKPHHPQNRQKPKPVQAVSKETPKAVPEQPASDAAKKPRRPRYGRGGHRPHPHGGGEQTKKDQ